MKTLVTGSAGHLGEALMRTFRAMGRDAAGVDIAASPFTTNVGSIVDRAFVRRSMNGADIVLHAATLHKPHVATHSRQDFVDTNISGTLNLLEEAVAAGVKAFIFTSTTSAFGRALTPPVGAPAAWIDEDVIPIPKNIYGVTKTAAEDLCALFHARSRLPIVILRTSRFFPEEDDDPEMRAAYVDANIKANEFLFRRVDVEDVVSAHLAAMERAPAIGFRRYIISATTPFSRDDAAQLRRDAPAVVERLVPEFAAEYARRGWKMFPSIERVYDNARARADLGWRPKYDFRHVVRRLAADKDPRSDLARAIGSKGYHDEVFADGPFPTER
ncbi:MAG: NAD(P)-dependent oxidoreductase [Parvularculaceae bacterium]